MILHFLAGYATGAGTIILLDAVLRPRRWRKLRVPIETTFGTEKGNRVTLVFDNVFANATLEEKTKMIRASERAARNLRAGPRKWDRLHCDEPDDFSPNK